MGDKEKPMPVLFRRASLAAASLALAAGLLLTLPIAPGGAVTAAPGSHEAIDPTWLLCRAENATVEQAADWKSFVKGKGVSERVDTGWRRFCKKKIHINPNNHTCK